MVLHLCGAAVQVDHLARVQNILPRAIEDQSQLLKKVAGMGQVNYLVQLGDAAETVSQIDERCIEVLALFVHFFSDVDELLKQDLLLLDVLWHLGKPYHCLLQDLNVCLSTGGQEVSDCS